MAARRNAARVAKYLVTFFDGRGISLIAWVVLTLFCWISTPPAPAHGKTPELTDNERHARTEKVESLVREALLARLHGDEQQCHNLLNQALDMDPEYPRARWLSGHVWERDRWVALDEHQRVAAAAELLGQYEERRQRAIRNPQQELMLARWCDRMGLLPQRDFHYGRLLVEGRLNESQRKEAIRVLNLRFVGGQYWNEEELAQLQAKAAAAMQALETWLPRLAVIERDLHSDDPARRAEAERRLTGMSAVDVLPALDAVMPTAGEPLALELVKVLGRDRAFDVTLTLARYAILSPSEAVRREATSALANRPLHEFVPFLLRCLNSPLRTQFAIFPGPNGTIQYQHRLFQEGHDANSLVQTNLASRLPIDPDAPVVTAPRRQLPVNLRRWNFANTDRDSLSLAVMGNLALAAAREMSVAQDNAVIQMQNARIFPVLQTVTGQRLPHQPLAWWQWWEQHNENPQDRPTQVQHIFDQSAVSLEQWVLANATPRHSCFAPGTPVWTERGLRPIESILPGDRVLSQHPDTGELSYKLVTRPVAGSPNSGMSRVRVGSEDIFITHGHVVWLNGQGWEIVRRIEPGNRLASLRGSSEVVAMADRPVTQVVHNLVVRDFHTFFVGREGILVHDITYTTFRQPTQAVLPGLLSDHTRAEVE